MKYVINIEHKILFSGEPFQSYCQQNYSIWYLFIICHTF